MASVSGRDKVQIDSKIPLWWIIASASAIVFSMGGVFVKLDQLADSVNNIEVKFVALENRTTKISQDIYEVKADNRIQQLQIDRVESNLTSLARRQQL